MLNEPSATWSRLYSTPCPVGGKRTVIKESLVKKVSDGRFDGGISEPGMTKAPANLFFAASPE
jgi:hypothetical protein